MSRSARFHLRNIGKEPVLPDSRGLWTNGSWPCIWAGWRNNALLVGLPQHLIARSQRCENVPARTVACRKKTCQTTPILEELHCMASGAIQDTVYKVLLQIFRALNELFRDYQVNTLERYVPVRPLRSADDILLTVPRTEHCWETVPPVMLARSYIWIGLPLAVWGAPSLKLIASKDS